MLNYFLYRFKYRFAQYLPLRAPVDVSMELSSHCTNTCGYCYHADRANLPFKRQFMKKDLALKILDEASWLGVNSLKFNYRGESTMNPDFYEITDYARCLARGGTFIDRITNSNFNFPAHREDIFQGLLNQTKVKVSFDSFIKPVFESQRRGSNYEKTLANIDRFYHYPGRRTALVIQAVRTMQNQYEDLHGEIRRRWPKAQASVRDVVGGRVAKDLSKVVIRERDASERQSCLQAHARLMIHADGKVGACCPDIKGQIQIGDANTQSLREIWLSPEAVYLRFQLRSGQAFEKDPCRTCSSFETYKGFKPSWDS